MEDNEKPYTMRLAEEGVESEVAYEAAGEADRRRLLAEKEQIKEKSPLQIVVENTDVSKAADTLGNLILKAFATGQETARRRQQQQPVTIQERPEKPAQPRREPEEVATSPLREEGKTEIDGGDS